MDFNKFIQHIRKKHSQALLSLSKTAGYEEIDIRLVNDIARVLFQHQFDNEEGRDLNAHKHHRETHSRW